MRFLRASTGSEVALSAATTLGVGGEARVFELLSDPGLAAKIWHRPTPDHGAKVAAMLSDPPGDPMAEHGHVSIAWPTDLLLKPSDGKTVVGFLMPKVKGMRPIIDFYHPKTRRHQHPLFSYLYLLRTARNLAACASALHARGYVIGDLNESNVLVNESALVTLIDTDSFQVPNRAADTVYRCRVGKPEFTAPELQQISFAWIDRKPEHDLFGLAVLIFQLLMEGTHPYAGRQASRGEPSPLEERIAAGTFPHLAATRGESLPMRGSPPFELLDPPIRDLFAKCFVEGHFKPDLRPDAQTWQQVLKEAELSLATCHLNDQHRFPRHLKSCPWCERRQLLGGLDPFPSQAMVQGRTHLVRPSLRFRVQLEPKPQELGYEAAVAIAKADIRRKRVSWWLLIATMSVLGVLAIFYWVWGIRFLLGAAEREVPAGPALAMVENAGMPEVVPTALGRTLAPPELTDRQ